MNGPMGVFEMKAFEKGTFGIVDILADLSKDSGAITIIGGGDSVAATELSGRAGDMSHLHWGRSLPGAAGGQGPAGRRRAQREINCWRSWHLHPPTRNCPWAALGAYVNISW